MIEKETLDPTPGTDHAPTSDQALIASVWPHLVAIGREGYQHEGRGVVVIPVDGANDPTQATYVSQASLGGRVHETGEPWPTEEIARRVETYNPEAEIVVLVMREDGGVHCYRVMGITQPDDVTVNRLN